MLPVVLDIPQGLKFEPAYILQRPQSFYTLKPEFRSDGFSDGYNHTKVSTLAVDSVGIKNGASAEADALWV